jgi:aminoglycoside 6'-N-acetyltransferase
MPETPYQFTRVTMAHFAMLSKWLTTPEVTRWWGDAQEQASILREDILDSRMAMSMNVVSQNDTPFAFIQDYEVHAWPQRHLASLPSGSRAIDTFIGVESYLGCGHGSAYLQQRAQHLARNGAPRIVIDPEVGNGRAIRAYEKAGFVRQSIEHTSEGEVVLMHFLPDQAVSASLPDSPL